MQCLWLVGNPLHHLSLAANIYKFENVLKILQHINITVDCYSCSGSMPTDTLCIVYLWSEHQTLDITQAWQLNDWNKCALLSLINVLCSINVGSEPTWSQPDGCHFKSLTGQEKKRSMNKLYAFTGKNKLSSLMVSRMLYSNATWLESNENESCLNSFV